MKLRGPLFSFFAAGWLGKYPYRRLGIVRNPYPWSLLPYGLKHSMYYSVRGWCYQTRRTWHGLQPVAMMPPVGPNPQTAKQQAWRSKFASGVAAWQSMNQTTKDYYHKLCYPRKASGYNRFLHYYMLDKPC